jgi:hypothetical protein
MKNLTLLALISILSLSCSPPEPVVTKPETKAIISKKELISEYDGCKLFKVTHYHGDGFSTPLYWTVCNEIYRTSSITR